MPQNVKVTRMRSFTVFTLAILLALPSLAAAAVTYNYDVRHRLTGVTYDNGATITYSYDGVGNRLTRTSTQATSSNYEDGEDGRQPAARPLLEGEHVLEEHVVAGLSGAMIMRGSL